MTLLVMVQILHQSLLVKLLNRDCRALGPVANPVLVKRGIDKTVQGLMRELEKRARPVEARDDVEGNVLA